ncbi:hypothetical protein [Streptomyces sp. PA5.6]|uniref:hypothetical protein n=1 Tax=Streptomyces sp. PA5.6 TaxID=3035651 RepID=UPI0039049612
MSEGDVKPVKDRLDALEESVQKFTLKFERGGAKGELVGASGSGTGGTGTATGASASVTGVSGEATLLSGGVKVWNFEYDMREEKEKRELRGRRELPDQLAERADQAKDRRSTGDRHR